MENSNQDSSSKTLSGQGGVRERFLVSDLPKGDFHAGHIAQKYYP